MTTDSYAMTVLTCRAYCLQFTLVSATVLFLCVLRNDDRQYKLNFALPFLRSASLIPIGPVHTSVFANWLLSFSYVFTYT